MTSHSIFNFFSCISFRHVPFCGLKTVYTQSNRYWKEKGEGLLEEEAH